MTLDPKRIVRDAGAALGLLAIATIYVLVFVVIIHFVTKFW